MVYNNLKNIDTATITGRGLILLIDLRVNGLIDSDYTEDTIIKKGDHIKYEDDMYLVRGVECMSTFAGFRRNIGCLVRKLKRAE